MSVPFIFLSSVETASLAMLTNAVLSFQDLDVIQEIEMDSSRKLLTLSRKYQDNNELLGFIHDINKFR